MTVDRFNLWTAGPFPAFVYTFDPLMTIVLLVLKWPLYFEVLVFLTFCTSFHINFDIFVLYGMPYSPSTFSNLFTYPMYL